MPPDICSPTFRAAAEARGLVDTDAEYELVMETATANKSPRQCRQLFSHLLLLCDIKDPFQLWETHRVELCQDYFQVHKNSDAAAQLGVAIRIPSECGHDIGVTGTLE